MTTERPGVADTFEWHRRFMRSTHDTTTKAVGSLLLTYADPDGTSVFPGRSRIAADLNMSVSTADRALKTLRGAGWIARVRRGTSNGKADEYRLRMPTATQPGQHTRRLVMGDDSSRVTTHSQHQCRPWVVMGDDPPTHRPTHDLPTPTPAPEARMPERRPHPSPTASGMEETAVPVCRKCDHRHGYGGPCPDESIRCDDCGGPLTRRPHNGTTFCRPCSHSARRSHEKETAA